MDNKNLNTTEEKYHCSNSPSGGDLTSRKITFAENRKLDSTVEDFMAEVMSTISEMNNSNRSDSVKKLKGIIKKNFGRECPENCVDQDGGKKRNRVHFSEENITIEIPRPPVSTMELVHDLCCYYCCFGYLFPHS